MVRGILLRGILLLLAVLRLVVLGPERLFEPMDIHSLILPRPFPLPA